MSSNCGKRGRGGSRRDRGASSRDGKPNHVKCLNFGLSILELDVLDQREQIATSSLGRVPLVIDQNVADIPCTGKNDYVRKWIEAHGDEEETRRCDPSSDSFPSSPVATATTINACGDSPVLGNSGKRFEKRMRANERNAAVETERRSADHRERSAGNSVDCATQRRLDYGSGEENENKRESRLNETPRTPPCIEKIVTDGKSPILGGRSYSRKRRRRKLRYDSEEGISAKRLMLRESKFTNARVDTDNDAAREAIFPIEEEASPERLETCKFLSQAQEGLSSDDGSSNNNKETPKIEIDTSCDSKDEDCNEVLSINGSSNDSPSNIIEEIDTQDTVVNAEKCQVLSRPLLVSKPSKLSQPITNVSNETYCSEAEMLLDQSMRLSAKISQVPSGALSKENATGSKSTQTLVISTITTPSKTSLDRTMHARLLDSGKKRRKPKKGSMAAKLQSLINAQVSSIRIWRHRMNRERDTASMQFISVLIRDCSERFGNQFLHGILIEDCFNLLRNNVEIEEAESREVQAPPKETTYRDITVILVCDIVGTLKMISQVVVNVYPPWYILDKVDLTLEATYISINHNREMPDLTSKNNPRERRIIKEFNCPCMEEGRELPFCSRKPNADKPDVMQVIFGA